MFFYQISTLTADIDIINSTTNSTEKPTLDARPGDGNDEFNAGTSGAGATLNPGDQLDGMGGTDTLKVYGNDSVAHLTDATIKNIEIVQAIGTGVAGSTAVNVSANADVKEVWLVKAANANTVTATTAQTVGIEGKATAGAQTVTYSGDTDGATDAATIMLKDANTSAGVTITGTPAADVVTIEKLTLEATGKNVLGTLADATLTDLVINGTGSVKATVDTTAATLKTIDASANKGGVELTLTVADLVATGTTITGGSGDDSIGFDADAKAVKFAVDLGAGDDTFVVNTGVKAGSVIKGGDGTADTLVLKGTTTTITATADKIFDGFENIKLDGTSTYHVGDIKGITGYEIGGTTAAGTITNLADDTTVTLSTGATGAVLTLKDASAATAAVTLNMNDTTSAITSDLATNAHVVNIISGGTTGGNALTAVTGTPSSLTNVTNYVVTGEQALKLTTGVATALTLVDASGMTGAKGLELIGGDITGTATVMKIKGSAGIDTITLDATTGDDIYTFVDNGGADKIGMTGGADDKLIVTFEDTTSNFAAAKMGGSSLFLNGAVGTAAAALSAATVVELNLGATLGGLLQKAGTTLTGINSALIATSAVDTLVTEGGKFYAGTDGKVTNYALSDSGETLTIQIDVNGDNIFNADQDYQISVLGTSTSMGYSAGVFTIEG